MRVELSCYSLNAATFPWHIIKGLKIWAATGASQTFRLLTHCGSLPAQLRERCGFSLVKKKTRIWVKHATVSTSAARATTLRKSRNLKWCCCSDWAAPGRTRRTMADMEEELRGEVRESGVRANTVLEHDQKVLWELSTPSSHCLDKPRPWLWFPEGPASEVPLEFQIGPIQELQAKLNTPGKTHFHHTHRNMAKHPSKAIRRKR